MESGVTSGSEVPGLECPRCGAHKSRPSMRKGMFELFLRLVMVTPFRCRGCRARFYKFGLHHEATEPEHVED